MKAAGMPTPRDREGELHALQSTALAAGGALAVVLLWAGLAAGGVPLLSAAGMLLALGAASALATIAGAWFFLRRRFRRGRDSESAFRATMAIIKGFFDSTPMRMGVVEVLPHDIRHIWDNAAAALYFGTTPLGLEDQLENKLAENTGETEFWLTQYRQCLQCGKPVRFEYAVEGDEGEARRWFSATVCPVAWKEGVDRHCAYVCQDITDLVRARVQAEEASRAKSVFLATMSHELRTPLNSIIGFAGILLKQFPEDPDCKERVYLQRIRSNGRHLLELINDILDLSKIEAGRLELDVEAVDLGEVLLATADLFEPHCREKGIHFELEGLDGSAEPLPCDRRKMRQILVNLVGNAVKFTPRGQVQLRLCIGADGTPRAVEVRDTGIGISPDQLDAIFEPFRQADSSVARKYGGSGLGLAISRALAEIMGFRLTVQSRVGEGSLFRLTFDDSEEGDTAPLESLPELVAAQ